MRLITIHYNIGNHARQSVMRHRSMLKYCFFWQYQVVQLIIKQFTDIHILYQQLLILIQYNQQVMAKSKVYQLVFFVILLLSVSATDPYGGSSSFPAITGEYYVNFVSTGTINQQIKVKIQASSISIFGCNTLQATFQYNASTKTYSVRGFISTRKACINDQDNLVTAAIANAKTASLVRGELVFENSQKTVTMRLTTSRPNFATGLQLSKIIGNYFVYSTRTATISLSIQVKITSSQISIQGCNSLFASFSYDSVTRKFKIGAFFGTLIYCANDQDKFVAEALQNSVLAIQRDEFLVFQDSNQDETLAISAKSYYQSTKTQVFGDFYVNTLSTGILRKSIQISITTTKIVVKGCNVNTATFTYNSASRTFTVGVFASTRVFCPNDQDSLVTSAISASKYLQNNNGLIAFKNSLFEETLTLSANQIVIEDTPKGVRISQIVGGYFVKSVVGANINTKIAVTITKTGISFKGCNSVSGSLTFNDAKRTFVVGPLISTLMFCPVDQDSFVSEALKNSVLAIWRGQDLVFQDENQEDTIVFSIKNLYDSDAVQVFGDFFASYASTGNLLKSIQVSITSNKIVIKGCNTNTATFTYNSATKTFTVGPFGSTRIYCKGDQDSLVTSAISGAKYLYKKNNQIIFEDSRNAETLALSFDQVFDDDTYTDDSQKEVFNEVSFKGIYYLRPVENGLSAVIATIDEDYIQFEGCNIHRFPYAAYSDNLFVLLQGGSSTERACLYDNDARYIQILTNANRFVQVNEDKIELYDQDTLLVRLQRRVRNSVVKYNVLNGAYELQINGLDVYVSKSTISLSGGCNSVSIPYQLTFDNKISFGNPISTLKACRYDFDSTYTKAITSAVAIQNVKDGFSLVDAYGKQVARFVSFIQFNQFKCRCFGGNYKVQLPNSGIRLSVSDGRFSLQGCNTFTFQFSVSDNGNIIFKNPSSTLVQCQEDYDSVYLNTILQAQTIAVLGSNIAFFNGEGTQIIKAINFDSSKTDNGTYDPENPIVGIDKFVIPNGNYKFAVLRTSYKTINLTVNKNVVNFRVCNNWSFSYEGTTNGLVKFSGGASTRIGCVNADEDKFYGQILLQIARFNQMKGMYTFFDKNGKSLATFVSDFGGSQFSNSQPIQQNPVILPQSLPVKPPVVKIIEKVSFKEIIEDFFSFKGIYKFQLPKIAFQLTPSQDVIVKGCETYRAPLETNSNRVKGNSANRKNNCPKKAEDFFFDFISQSSSSFRKETTTTSKSSSFSFFSSASDFVFKAQTVVTKTKQVVSGIKSGSYVTEFPGIDVSFDDSTFTFGGCNQGKFEYKAKNTGNISVSGNGCSNQKFDAYKNAILGATKYRPIDNGYIFEDEKGNEKARCTKK